MEKKQKEPMGFGRTMLASAVGMIIGFVVINIIGFILMMCIMAAAIASTGNQAVPISGNNIWLKIDLSKNIVEHKSNNVFVLFGEDETVALNEVLKAIEKGRTDERIVGLYIYGAGSSTLSWAQSEEVRNAVIEFKNVGKPVVAYGTAFSQPEYYLATAAGTIALHPSGMVDFRGLGTEVMFYKDLFDKLGVHVELIRPTSNAYKSAGETFTMNHISEANKEQVRAYITSIWNHVLQDIADARSLSTERVNGIADNLEGCLASDAAKCGLVDTLLFESDMKTFIKERYEGKKIVSAKRYAQSLTAETAKEKIAIVYAEGDVVQGSNNGFQTAVYSDDIVASFEKAAKDENVKAIVLRINSPGGDAIASESMTHAIMLAKAKKPVIVSMSGVAASAGYEIACNATKIVAQPTTITGSIGVFGMIPELGSLLKNKIGITTDTVKTNANATGMSIMRPLSPSARAMMQRNVEDFYVTFCQRVADGRGLSREYVEGIAQGRVWSGVDAKRIGLVDSLGGMSLALRLAAEEAGIEKYSTETYPKEKSLLEQLKMAGSSQDEIVLQKKSGRSYSAARLLKDLEFLCEMNPVQARMPFLIIDN